MTAPARKSAGVVERWRAKFLSRPKAPPAYEADLTDEGYAIREQLVELAGRAGRLGRLAGLAGETAEALRAELHREREAKARLGDELAAERLARTAAEMRLLEAGAALESMGGALERTGIATFAPAAKRLVEMAVEMKREGSGS